MELSKRDFLTRFRVIPVLLLQDVGFYKGKKFKDHKYIGDPVNTIKLFNEKEADELMILDINASRYNQPANFELIQEICSEAFVPVAYGGGIRTMEDVVKIIECGVEKVVLNSILYKEINLINEIADVYGRQSIVVSLDVRKNLFGKYILYSHSGKVKETIDVKEIIKKAIDLGCGEILINSIDRDGSKNGFDMHILDEVVATTNVPIIICGGLGHDAHIIEAYKHNVSAVSGGSYFVFQGKHDAVLISYPNKHDIFERLF